MLESSHMYFEPGLSQFICRIGMHSTSTECSVRECMRCAMHALCKHMYISPLACLVLSLFCSHFPPHSRSSLISLIDYRLSTVEHRASRAMGAPCPKIREWIQQAIAGIKVVSNVDKILAELESTHLAYRSHLCPPRVGIHPINRDGYGVSEPEVHALGSEIVAMGWSWNAASHAVCMEDGPNQEISMFSMGIKNSTDGLASCGPNEVRFGSLACTDTNQFLCCVLAGVPTMQTDLARDGFMSKEVLIKSEEEFENVLSKGLEWLVIKFEVGQLYPELASLVQAARNSPGQSQRMETEFQILLRISSLARSMCKVVDNQPVVDWDAVEKTIRRRKTNDPADIPDLIKYVQRWGGGLGGFFISELNVFHPRFVPSGRTVAGSTFRAVASLKLAPDELIPHVATAIIKAQASIHRISHICAIKTIGGFSIFWFLGGW